MLEESLAITILGLAGWTAISYGPWRSGRKAAWRRLARPFPVCGGCGYPFKGLTEARCPECGAVYTLDQLWLAQRDRPEEDFSD